MLRLERDAWSMVEWPKATNKAVRDPPPRARAHEQVIDIYRTTDSGEERRQCLSALGKAKDSALLGEAMDFILDSGEVWYHTAAVVTCLTYFT